MNDQKKWSLEWFQCPYCKQRLSDQKSECLRCINCGREYPIKSGIPVFLMEFLKPAETQEKEFWESDYNAREDGSFKTLADESYQTILSFFSIPNGGLGLEFASGSGAFSEFIDDCTMVGLDISLSLLKSTKSLIPIQGSGEVLPFRDDLFDFVLCAAALHHIPDLQKAVNEIARVVKKGGKIFILEPNCHHPQRKLVAKERSPWRKAFSSTHFSPAENLIPETKLLRILGDAHFSLESKWYMTPAYRSVSVAGRLQNFVSRYLAKGMFARYLESYVLMQARLQ